MSKKQNKSSSDFVYLTFVYTVLVGASIVVLYPLLYVVSASFSSPNALIAGKVFLWPVEPTLMAYKAVFQSKQILTGFQNSFMYTLSGTAINLIVTCFAAYPLSRPDFKGRNYFMIFIVFTMMFSGGLIPLYLTVRSLGMLDSIWAIIIPGAASAWYIIITRTFFQASIPPELKDAADIDGCSDFTFFLKIVIPLSKPILFVLMLMYGVDHWNSFFNALIYLNNPKLYPLQLFLNNILVQNIVDPLMMKSISVQDMKKMQYLSELLKYAVIVIATLPFLIVYPFIQKHFIKGVMLGSLKG